ncbi:alpha-mannosidase [Paludisphaera mucosa]|uniref:Glycoside hydrolase family 38 C-terminal domain-containing protein n=1 Tax=Paludisphaera mucosa TaxID=3030827 RepID=A0ABT6FG51_9BACT|nr:glycoside hydrolase family 38 C-terminal domain-containing protein [Paludisphaera mucosa]MDG3006373.1 glycoside hydrolase family 38 C-terminal domain-containing protein [Paludisphaera mucosa]
MIQRGLIVVGAWFALFQAGSAGAADPPAAEKSTFWVIPHTHWEGAVFKTREEYLEMGLPNILKALRLLEEQPGNRFVLDQVAYVRPFLERYPDQEPLFRRLVAEGRLQITGGMDVMPDVNMPGGESFVRQVQYGKGYYRDKLGIDVTTGWLIDTFGHHAQMPQLMKLAGFRSYWTQRGVPYREHPAEFLWEGIDGTRLATFYMPATYALLYGSPNDPAKFREFLVGRFGALDRNAPGPHRVGLAGVDVGVPEPHLAPMVEAFDKAPDSPFRARMATPSDFEAVIGERTDLPVFKGELSPIFQGAYSSRIELKTWMRRIEERLLTAEKLAAIEQMQGGGGASDLPALWRAWEPALFNETHDLASGVMTDHVYDDVVGGFQFSDRLAAEQIARGWDALAARIDTRGEGVPIVVFNPLSWTRSDLAEVDLGFSAKGVGGVEIVDDRGAVRPSQVVASTTYPDGGVCKARVAFVAADVPSLGYRTYHARPASSPATPPAPAPATVALENRFYKITLDPGTGALVGLRVKDGDWEVFKGPANVVARHQDKGDVWELYKGLDGGSNIAMKTVQPVPARGSAKFSDESHDAPGTLVSGPVYSEFRVAHSFDSGGYASTVRLYADLPRIDCTTTLVNNEKYVRYQVLFPTTIAAGKRFDEIPFGASERPDGIEFPAQNWSDLSGSGRGLAVLNIGLPGHVVTEGTLMVSTLRSHNLGAYGFGGGYEPGMSSEGAFQIGKEWTARYALLPHAGDWRDAGVPKAGLEFNHPLIARTVGSHEGSLPTSRAFVDVSAPNVVVSSLKPARGGGVALRLYETSGRPAPATVVKLPADIVAAGEADLLENVPALAAVAAGSVSVDLAPFQIKTLVLQRKPRAPTAP